MHLVELHNKDNIQTEKSQSSRQEICQDCHGSGSTGDGTCPSCNGKGVI